MPARKCKVTSVETEGSRFKTKVRVVISVISVEIIYRRYCYSYALHVHIYVQIK